MLEGFTPHCKAITIANGLTSSITLTAANGSSIQCNRIVVTASATDTSSASFLVVPSGVSQYPAIGLTNGASGTYGYLVGSFPTPIILGHGKRTSAVSITNLSGQSRTVLVMYGVAHMLNTIDKGHLPYI